MTKPGSEPRTIEQLKQEFELLNEKKIQTQTQLDEATKQLKNLQQQAVAEFQTCDIDELQEKLAQMEQENEQRRREYQELLDSISKELKEIEVESNSSALSSDSTDD